MVPFGVAARDQIVRERLPFARFLLDHQGFVERFMASPELETGCQLVGTHTGRRTFIVNALSLGITPNIVMKWTGHSDYKAMKPYIDIVDSLKASSMTKFDGLI